MLWSQWVKWRDELWCLLNTSANSIRFAFISMKSQWPLRQNYVVSRLSWWFYRQPKGRTSHKYQQRHFMNMNILTNTTTINPENHLEFLIRKGLGPFIRLILLNPLHHMFVFIPCFPSSSSVPLHFILLFLSFSFGLHSLCDPLRSLTSTTNW